MDITDVLNDRISEKPLRFATAFTGCPRLLNFYTLWAAKFICPYTKRRLTNGIVVHQLHDIVTMSHPDGKSAMLPENYTDFLQVTKDAFLCPADSGADSDAPSKRKRQKVSRISYCKKKKKIIRTAAEDIACERRSFPQAMELCAVFATVPGHLVLFLEAFLQAMRVRPDCIPRQKKFVHAVCDMVASYSDVLAVCFGIDATPDVDSSCCFYAQVDAVMKEWVSSKCIPLVQHSITKDTYLKFPRTYTTLIVDEIRHRKPPPMSLFKVLLNVMTTPEEEDILHERFLMQIGNSTAIATEVLSMVYEVSNALPNPTSLDAEDRAQFSNVFHAVARIREVNVLSPRVTGDWVKLLNKFEMRTAVLTHVLTNDDMTDFILQRIFM